MRGLAPVPVAERMGSPRSLASPRCRACAGKEELEELEDADKAGVLWGKATLDQRMCSTQRTRPGP